jgi:hypothetical protein
VVSGLLLVLCAGAAEPPPIQRPSPSPPPSDTELEADFGDEDVGPPDLPPIDDGEPPDPEVEGPPPEDSPYPDGLLPVGQDELLPPATGAPPPLSTGAELKVRALLGQVGVLVMRDGSEKKGLIRRAGVDHLAVVDNDSGEIEIVAIRNVVDARFLGSEDLPEQSGIGLLVGGSILASIGTPVFVSGIAFSIVLSEEPAVYAPMLLIGGAALGAGIAMVVQGARRRRAYNKAVEGRAAFVTPGGLFVRF